MPVFLLALGRLPYWEHDSSPASVHLGHRQRIEASTALDAPGPLLDLATKGTDGGQVRAPFRIKSRTQSWQLNSAPSKLHANETCNEKVVYSERCQKQHNRYTRTLDKAHGKRGVYFEFPGKASWGLGHSLSMVYLLHDVCMRARRVCHIKLHDTELHLLLGYRTGQGWGPPVSDTECSTCGYKLDKARKTSLLPGAFSWESEQDIEGLVSELRDSLTQLVHITSNASIAFNSHSFLPALPWDATPEEGNPRLTRCFNSFVSHPRFDVPPSTQRATYLLGTSFADVDDSLLPPRGDPAETAAWIRAACGQESLGRKTHVMSDAPGLTERLGGRAVPQALLQSSQQKAAAREVKRIVASDVVVASRSVHLYAQSTSALVRPIAARSMCARRVFQMGHESSACPDFEDIFPSGLFASLSGEDSTPSLATGHPCGGLARRQCRDKFLAAMQGAGEDGP